MLTVEGSQLAKVSLTWARSCKGTALRFKWQLLGCLADWRGTGMHNTWLNRRDREMLAKSKAPFWRKDCTTLV